MSMATYILACTFAGFMPQVAEIISDIVGYDPLAVDALAMVIVISLITAVKRGA